MLEENPSGTFNLFKNLQNMRFLGRYKVYKAGGGLNLPSAIDKSKSDLKVIFSKSNAS